MHHLVEQLNHTLCAKQPTGIRHLDDGASEELINELAKINFANLEQSQILFSLYSWADGTVMSDDKDCLQSCLFPDFYLLSITEIQYQIKTNLFFNFKSHDLIPLFRSCDGDFLAIKKESLEILSDDTSVYFCSARVCNDDNFISIYDSLKSMLETIIECYNEGIFLYNRNFPQVDFERLFIVASKKNPRSHYWKSDLIM